MSSRRILKAAEAIREVVSMAILVELRDPRIENVTVTYVEVSGDMRNARVNVSVMGDEKKQKLCLDALGKAAGFLQRKVNDRIETRYTPRITFRLDNGVKHSLAVARILEDVLPSEEESASGDSPENLSDGTVGSAEGGHDGGADNGGADSAQNIADGSDNTQRHSVEVVQDQASPSNDVESN